MKDIELILQNPQLTRLMLQAFQSILADTDTMVFVKDANLVYQAANMPFVRMVGKTCLDDVVGRSDFDIFEDPLLAQRYVADDHQLFARDEDKLSFIEPLPEENGRTRFARTSKYVLRDSDGKIIGLAGISRDVTQEIVAAEDYQKEIAYLFELPEDVFMAVYIDVTDWRIIGERQHGVEKRSFHMHENTDVLREKAFCNVVDSNDSAKIFYRDFNPATLRDIYESGRRSIVMEYLRRFDNADDRWVRDEINLLVDPSTNHLCLTLTVRDIHQRKMADVNLMWAAERDEMTGLLNRASIIKNTRHFLSGDAASASHAMFMIDIDNFKQINDTYGHQAGDRFLIQIARTIRKSFRDSDLVGRIGGDEFVVLMKYTPNVRVVQEKGKVFLAALNEVCHKVSGLNVSASIGVSLYARDGKTFEELYEKADSAMYTAKRRGKGGLLFAKDLSADDKE